MQDGVCSVQNGEALVGSENHRATDNPLLGGRDIGGLSPRLFTFGSENGSCTPPPPPCPPPPQGGGCHLAHEPEINKKSQAPKAPMKNFSWVHYKSGYCCVVSVHPRGCGGEPSFGNSPPPGGGGGEASFVDSPPGGGGEASFVDSPPPGWGGMENGGERGMKNVHFFLERNTPLPAQIR